jgi:5-hydroxyisourate hydrolase-like protein (transthyretin family)
MILNKSILAGTLLLISLISCGNNISGTTDETLSGVKVAYSDGRPADSTHVKIFAAGDTSRNLIMDGYTNKNGNVILKLKEQGVYTLVAEKDSFAVFVDSLHFSKYIQLHDTLVLNKAGSITGMIRVQPNDDPRAFYVVALGTDKFVNVELTGSFKLDGLANGNYTIAIISAKGRYTPTFIRVMVVSDKVVSIPNIILPHYLGIPVVNGLAVDYDPINGVVNISWEKPDYYSLKEYVIVTEKDGRIDTLISSDTVYHDTIYPEIFNLPKWYPPFALNDSSTFRIKYSVAVRNMTHETGSFYDEKTVSIVSPRYAQPSMIFQQNSSIVEFVSGQINKDISFKFSIVSKLDSIASVSCFSADSNFHPVIIKLEKPAINYSDSSVVKSTVPGVTKYLFEINTIHERKYFDTINVVISDTTSSSVNDTSLIGAWNFNEADGNIAMDCSGHCRTGFLQGCQKTAGKYSSALLLNGRSRMIINPDPAFKTDAFSVSFWILIDSITNCSIITQMESGVSTPGGYSIDVSEKYIRFQTSFGEPGGIAVVKSDSVVSSMEKNWIHVAAIFNKGKIQRLFINGIQQKDSTYNSIRLNDIPIIIGDGFVGKIDDLKIYSRVIEEKEIERFISESAY